MTTAQEFNDRYPVGTPVAAFPITRDDPPLLTTTRTPAWELGHGTPVVSALTHIDPRPAAPVADTNGWPGDEHAEPGTRGWTC